jgi:hypothetical protein
VFCGNKNAELQNILKVIIIDDQARKLQGVYSYLFVIDGKRFPQNK